MNRVLFICSGNYYRSRFAEILFNTLARQRNLSWTADSRGFRLNSQNVGAISVHTAHACKSRGLTYDCERMPKVLEESDLIDSQRIVALKETEHRPMMQARFPTWEAAVEYWEIHDIDASEPAAALAELSAAVERLIEECSTLPEAGRGEQNSAVLEQGSELH